MGGAHAIAAFAFGTETVPKVDRIVGPGNIYVAAAKKLLAGEVGIDFVAGPTEILIIAEDGRSHRCWPRTCWPRPSTIVEAAAILVTTTQSAGRWPWPPRSSVQLRTLADGADRARGHRAQQRHHPGRDRSRSAVELVEPLRARAPQHSAMRRCSARITNAGSVFIGPHSPEAAGDYASGPNHVLPTSGVARVRGGLSAADFVKVISVQELSRPALSEAGARHHDAGAGRGPRSARPLRGGATPWLTPLPNLRPREAVLRMAPYSPPTGGRAGKLRLDFNENTVGCSPRVIEFLRRSLEAPTGWPSIPNTARPRRPWRRSSASQPDQLLFTNGTDEAIQVIVNTYVDDGDDVLLLRPSYAMYRFYAEVAGASIREIDYRPGDLAFPLEELLDAIRPSTRAMLIANPNNPTGTGVGVEGIERILRASAANAAVLIDEAYFEFSGVTALPLVGRAPNLFVSRTFSKVYRHGGDAAGLRLLAGGERRLPAQSAVAVQREHAGGAGRHRGRPGQGLHRRTTSPRCWPRGICCTRVSTG